MAESLSLTMTQPDLPNTEQLLSPSSCRKLHGCPASCWPPPSLLPPALHNAKSPPLIAPNRAQRVCSHGPYPVSLPTRYSLTCKHHPILLTPAANGNSSERGQVEVALKLNSLLIPSHRHRRMLYISTFCFNPRWEQVGKSWDCQLETESLSGAPDRTEPCSACVQPLQQCGFQLRAHNGWHELTYLYVQFPLVLFEHSNGIKSTLGWGRGSLRAILQQLNGDNFKDH